MSCSKKAFKLEIKTSNLGLAENNKTSFLWGLRVLSFATTQAYVGFAFNVIHCAVMIYSEFQTARKLENRCLYMYVKWAMYFTIACQKLMNKFSFILSKRKMQ